MNPVSRPAWVARWAARENTEERFVGLAKPNVRKASRLDQDWRQVEDSALSWRALGSTVPGFLLNTGRPGRWQTLQFRPQGCSNFTYEVNRTYVDTGRSSKIDPLAGTQQDIGVTREGSQSSPQHHGTSGYRTRDDISRARHPARPCVCVPSRKPRGKGLMAWCGVVG